MAQKRYEPRTIKKAVSKDSLDVAPIWKIFDTETKQWWNDSRNKPTNYYDAALSCGVLNGD